MIKPVGQKIIVLPLERKEEMIGKIVVASTANAELSEAIVIAVPQALEDVYKEGETILYPTKSGVGQIINGKPHLWLNHEIGEVWGIVDSKKSIVVDKEDNL